MKELELKDICGYLPYDLKIMDTEREAVFPFLGYEIDTTLTKILLYDEETDWWNLSNFKPILRPLSDLYKPIIHNGKEIFPIVELAKRGNGCAVLDNHWMLVNNGAETQRNRNGFYRFEYNEALSFFENYWRGTNNGVSYRKVKYQYQLFDYLHELKIDYRGLIDAGLAISVHDLEFNPYN